LRYGWLYITGGPAQDEPFGGFRIPLFSDLDLAPEIEASYAAQAEARGVPLPQYLQRVLEDQAVLSAEKALTPAERAVAPVLHRTLKECARRISAGSPIAGVLADGRKTISTAGFALDYLEARDADTLAPVRARANGPIRLLVAARLGKTRLIDNHGV